MIVKLFNVIFWTCIWTLEHGIENSSNKKRKGRNGMGGEEWYGSGLSGLYLYTEELQLMVIIPDSCILEIILRNTS